MKKTLLLCFLSVYFSLLYSQEPIFFSDALRGNIRKHNVASNKAYRTKDFAKAQEIFDSLVQKKLVGTMFDDFTVKGYRTKKVNLYRQEKPLLVITYASWCLINKGEAPALNKLAKDYKDKINIIVLFWNKKNDIKKIAGEFTKDIKVCYANENYKDDFRIIAIIKHTLGLPICFLIDENKQLVYMRRIASKKINLRTYPNTTITNHYKTFKKDIDYYILKKDTTYVSGF